MKNVDGQLPPLALLAGGLATRLEGRTRNTPKSLLEVAGEPFVAHQMRLLARQGISRVVACLGHLAAPVMEFLGDGSRFGLSVDYSLDGATQLGTGGALRKALDLLGPRFLVMYGDSYLDTQFRPIVASFEASGKRGLMTVFRNQDRWDRSNIVFSNGAVLCYDKETRTDDMEYIDYGLGVLNAEALSEWPKDRAFELSMVYQKLLQQGELAGYEINERFYEIGSPSGLKELDRVLSMEGTS